MIEYVYKHGGSAVQRRTPGVGKRIPMDYKSLSTSINMVGVPCNDVHLVWGREHNWITSD